MIEKISRLCAVSWGGRLSYLQLPSHFRYVFILLHLPAFPENNSLGFPSFQRYVLWIKKVFENMIYLKFSLKFPEWSSILSMGFSVSVSKKTSVISCFFLSFEKIQGIWATLIICPPTLYQSNSDEKILLRMWINLTATIKSQNKKLKPTIFLILIRYIWYYKHKV